MKNQLISHWLLPMINELSITKRRQNLLWPIDYSLMSLIIHDWLPIGYLSITNFPPDSAINTKKYPFFIEMMFSCRWSDMFPPLPQTEHFVAYRLLIDYPLIIGNNQWLINWLPIDYTLISLMLLMRFAWIVVSCPWLCGCAAND